MSEQRSWGIGERVHVMRNRYGHPTEPEEVIIASSFGSSYDGRRYIGVLRPEPGCTPFFVNADQVKPIPPKPETVSGEVVGTVTIRPYGMWGYDIHRANGGHDGASGRSPFGHALDEGEYVLIRKTDE